GADLEPGTVLTAYRRGLFPMPMGGRRAPMAWFSPVRRGILRPRDLHVSRSLARSVRRFEIRVDTACAEVIDACADPTRPSGWIDDQIRTAYLRLHELGWVHSVETWRDGRSAACSPGSRCSTTRPTPRRSPCSGWSASSTTAASGSSTPSG